MVTNQAELFEMLRSYQQSALLIALVELDLCSVLAKYPEGASVEELAVATGLQSRPLRALLMAVATTGLLMVEAGRYRNSSVSARYLTKSSPQYKGDPVKSALDQYLGYAQLAQAVRSGNQVLPNLQKQAEAADHDPALRRLLLGLHSGGKQLVPLMVPHLAPYLAKASNLLDVGSGVGTYSIAFAEQYQQLQVLLLDQPSVLEIAAEIMEKSPAEARVQLLSADYHLADFGSSDYDIILLFQVLRTESPATIQRLLSKAAQGLKPGGVVVIYDTFLEESRTAPVENVFQHLTLALTYPEGGLFTSGELNTWLQASNFAQPDIYPIEAARPMFLAVAERKEL